MRTDPADAPGALPPAARPTTERLVDDRLAAPESTRGADQANRPGPLWVHLYEVVRSRPDRLVHTSRWARVTELDARGFTAAYLADELTWLPFGETVAIHVLVTERVSDDPARGWARSAHERDGGLVGPERVAGLSQQHAAALRDGPLHRGLLAATTAAGGTTDDAPATGASARLDPTLAPAHEVVQPAGRDRQTGPARQPELCCLVYTSRATRRLSSSDLVELLRVARINNERAGLTGMLLHHEGHFVQQLEGAPDSVDAVLAALLGDPRHTDLTILARHTAAARDFALWTMGFDEPDAGGLTARLPGYLPLTVDQLSAGDGSRTSRGAHDVLLRMVTSGQ